MSARTTGKPATKRLRLDINVPDEIARAFIGLHLPVAVARDSATQVLKKLVAKLPAAERRSVRGSFLGGGTIGTIELKHLSRYSPLDVYASELKRVGVAVPDADEMLRAVPSGWSVTPRRDDEIRTLQLLSGYARATHGVLYARPGGRALQATDDKTIAVGFDFASGEPRPIEL